MSYQHLAYNPNDDDVKFTLSIGGVIQQDNDYIIGSFEENVGGLPATLEIFFPLLETYTNNWNENTVIILWINRHIDPIPKFIGYIKDYEELPNGEGLKILCQDLRCRLEEGTCNKNYNERDENGDILTDANGQVKYYSIRQCLEDIWTQYLSMASGDSIKLQKSFSNIPNQYAGERKFEGSTFLDAINELVQAVYGKKYFIYLQYLESGTGILKIGDYDNGIGRKDIYYGTDPSKTPNNQNFGLINAKSIHKSESPYAKMDQVIIYGANIIIESAVILAKAWDTTITDSVMNNYESFTEKGSNESLNANYNAKATYVWKRFKIPQINDNGIRRQVPHYKSLISNNHKLIDEFNNPMKPKNFVVVKWLVGGSPIYRVIFDGYSIENNTYVQFSKPLFEVVTNETTGLEEYNYPSAVYLNFAYISRLKGSCVYPLSTSGQIKRIYLNEPSANFWGEYNNFNITQLTAGESATVTYYSGFRTVRNDYSVLRKIAIDEFTKRNVIKKNIQIPVRIEEPVKIGQKVYLNMKNSDCIIISIQYNIDEQEKILVCQNYNE